MGLRVSRASHRQAYRQHGSEANGAGRLLTRAARKAMKAQRIESTGKERTPTHVDNEAMYCEGVAERDAGAHHVIRHTLLVLKRSRGHAAKTG
jgi:hypothetical protein